MNRVVSHFRRYNSGWEGNDEAEEEEDLTFSLFIRCSVEDILKALSLVGVEHPENLLNETSPIQTDAEGNAFMMFHFYPGNIITLEYNTLDLVEVTRDTITTAEIWNALHQLYLNLQQQEEG